MSLSDTYDLFICYRGEKGGVLAADIYSEILLHSKDQIRPFFAPKCIKKGENFKDACWSVASNVALMIVILSPGFFDGCFDPEDIVYGELKNAMKNENTAFLPITIQDFDFKSQDLSGLFTESEISRIKYVNGLEFRDVYSFSAYEMLLPVIKDKIGIHDFSDLIRRTAEIKAVGRKHISDDTKKGYFSTENKSEIRRLNQQQQLLLKYDMDVYNKYLDGKQGLNVLDIGSSDGKALMSRLQDRSEVAKIIGVEFDKNSVDKANEKYQGTKAKFYCVDLESEDFDEQIRDIMDENDIDKFDFVNILAVISHLKSPFKVLKSLKKISKKGAVFFVRNIDDGANLAYPDPDGNLKRAFDILAQCDTVGYRFSGRELYSLFRRLEFSDIKLEKFGLTNVDMDYDEKTAFFDVIFPFIRNGIDKAVQKHPDNTELLVEHMWLHENWDELEEHFLSYDTFINFGFLIYVAIV